MALYILSLITLLSLALTAYLVRVPSGPARPGCGWNARLRGAPRPQLARVTVRERSS